MTTDKKKFDNIKFADYRGIARWARLHPHQRDFKAEYDYDKVGGVYSMDLVVSEDEAKRAENDGVTIHRDKETGAPFLKLRRDHQKVWKDGTVQEKGPPTLVYSDGVTPVPEDVELGNGSEVNVRVYIKEYKAKKYSTRLMGVQVIKLVEYKPNNTGEKRGMFNPVTTSDSVDEEETL